MCNLGLRPNFRVHVVPKVRTIGISGTASNAEVATQFAPTVVFIFIVWGLGL